MRWRVLSQCKCRLCVEAEKASQRRERIVDVLFGALCLVVFLAMWCVVEAAR